MPGLARAALAGLAYAVALFLVGSAVGAIRVLVLQPRYGALHATALELPLMLGLAWLLGASLARRCAVAARAGDRILMGGVALLMLLALDVGFASLLGTRLDYRQPAALLGLAGQVAAAILPLVQARFLPRDFRALP